MVYSNDKKLKKGHYLHQFYNKNMDLVSGKIKLLVHESSDKPNTWFEFVKFKLRMEVHATSTSVKEVQLAGFWMEFLNLT